ncbi:MAG: hypothetical protein KDD67_06910 [Ignavibacteriae bacterium]|nr:hypothetical protein [Ignavibacteriota bacterium]MCB9215207.1 hypothetical protein [Ignavibacteria bacterium]
MQLRKFHVANRYRLAIQEIFSISRQYPCHNPAGDCRGKIPFHQMGESNRDTLSFWNTEDYSDRPGKSLTGREPFTSRSSLHTTVCSVPGLPSPHDDIRFPFFWYYLNFRTDQFVTEVAISTHTLESAPHNLGADPATLFLPLCKRCAGRFRGRNLAAGSLLRKCTHV